MATPIPLDVWAAEELNSHYVTYRKLASIRDLRLVVINQLELHPRNAPWGLFATDEAHWRAAFRSYRPRSDVGTHLHNLIAHHRFGEGKMAHTYEDMKREARDWLKTYLPQLAPEERLEGLDPEEVLGQFDPDVIEVWLKKQRNDH